MWKIKNAEEQLSFIQALKNNEKINLDKVKLSFPQEVKIKIQGDPLRYNGSINNAICKRICEFQNEIWRACAALR